MAAARGGPVPPPSRWRRSCRCAAGGGGRRPRPPSGRAGPGGVLERGERAQRQEARLEVADRPLHGALRGRPAGPQHDGPGMERAQEPADLGVEPRPAALARGHDRGVVVEHVGIGHAAEAEGAARGAPAGRHRPSGRGLNTAAWAPDQGSVVTSPNASRTSPRPTGTPGPRCATSRPGRSRRRVHSSCAGRPAPRGTPDGRWRGAP